MILWLDDDIDATLSAHIDELEDNGYTVLRANTPEKMWQILNEQYGNVSGIVLDIMLPTGENIDNVEADRIAAKAGVHTGIVLLKQLRDDIRYRDIPIIIFTILSDQELVDVAKEYKFLISG